MTDAPANRAENWFTPARFGVLLALLIFAAFPKVLLGLETFIVRDFGFFAYPLAHFQQQCFQRGELPLWDPYNNCGAPFLAQWNTMPLYPPSLIYLTLPLEWSLGVFCLAHLWWAGLGMYFLARRWTGSPPAAAFAGVAFAFNGLTLNLLMWPSHIATFSWMPWVILAVELAWRQGGHKILLAAFAGALQMLAGGPETILLTWLLLLALWLQQVITGGRDAAVPSTRIARLWRFPLVVVLVISLSAAQLLPFLDLVAHSQRDSGFSDLRWSMPASGWANFLVPMAFGMTSTEGIFLQSGQYWTSSYYLGLGTLWLAWLAVLLPRTIRRTGPVGLLGAASALALLFALGNHTPVYPLVRKLIPLLSFITYPVKYVAVLAFAAPLLAAFALANLASVRKRIFFVGTILAGLIVAILIWTQQADAPADDRHATLANALSRLGLLLLTGVILGLRLRSASRRTSLFASLGLLAVVWLDVVTHEPVQNPTVSPWIYQPGLARQKLAMQPQPEFGGSRAMVSPGAWHELIGFAARDPQNNFLAKRLGYCANVNLLDDLPKTDGFFSLTPREYEGLNALIYGSTNFSFSRLEDFMGVSQITADDEVFHWQARPHPLPLVTAGQQPVYLNDSDTLGAFLRNDFDPQQIIFLPPETRPFVTVSQAASARILASKFNDRMVDITADAEAPALVAIAQSWYHDWRAEIDGRPARLLRANVAFQAVEMPAGRHRIHLYYRDLAFEIGAAITVPMWVNCLVCLVVLRFRPPTSTPAVKMNDDYF